MGTNTPNKEFDNQVIIPVNVASSPISRAIERGDYFAGSITRTGVAISSTFYWLVTAKEKDLIINHIDPKFNLSAVLQGTLTYVTDVFMQQSNRNDFSYSGGTANASFGACVNGYYINKASNAQLSAGGTVSGLTGVPDYVITDANVFLATQGNANSQSGTVNSFFEGDNVIIIPANTTALFRSVASGSATGTLSIDTALFFTERAV